MFITFLFYKYLRYVMQCHRKIFLGKNNIVHSRPQYCGFSTIITGCFVRIKIFLCVRVCKFFGGLLFFTKTIFLKCLYVTHYFLAVKCFLSQTGLRITLDQVFAFMLPHQATQFYSLQHTPVLSLSILLYWLSPSIDVKTNSILRCCSTLWKINVHRSPLQMFLLVFSPGGNVEAFVPNKPFNRL